ncbi:MAG: polysaccharide deacetylase family protein [Angustibacter sp.]
MAGLARRTLLGGAAACLLGGAGVVSGTRAEAREDYVPGMRTATHRARHAAQPDGVFAVSTSRRMVALTFDDGPDPAYTPHVLDLLDHYDARATFFTVGVNALVWRDLAQEVVRRGHTVANHTHSHADLYLMGRPAVTAELGQGTADLLSVGLPRPGLFRPPKGWTSPTVARVADRLGLRTAFWTQCVEALHPATTAPRDVAALMVRRAAPGQILLAHDGGRVMCPDGQTIDRSATMEVLPFLLSGLRSAGWAVVDLPTLLARGPAR